MLLPILMVVSWLTVLMLKKEDFKRFLPASILISLFVRGESVIARKRKWWWFYEKIHPKLTGEFPLIWGPFLIGSIWILKLTYRKFPAYILLNLTINSAFVYVFIDVCKKIGVLSLVRLSKLQLLAIFTFKALLLYAFQITYDKLFQRID